MDEIGDESSGGIGEPLPGASTTASLSTGERDAPDESTDTTSDATSGDEVPTATTFEPTEGEPVPEDPLLPTDFVLHYTFDEPADEMVLDDGPHAFHAICSICPVPSAGVKGLAGVFSNTDATLARDPQLEPSAFSIATWIRLDARPQDYMHVFGKPIGTAHRNTYELYFRSLPTEVLVNFSIGNTTTTTHSSGPFPEDGDFHHLAGTFDGVTLILYLDGLPIHDNVSSSGIQYDDNPLYLGHDSDHQQATNHFEGALDELYFFDRALTPEEISALAQP